MELDPTPSSLHDRVRRAVRDAITSGALRPGDRTPSSRALAADLGVSRATVVAAFETLIAEGFLEARRGSGTYVAAHVAPPIARRAARRSAAAGGAVKPEARALSETVARLTARPSAPVDAVDLRHGMPTPNPRVIAAWRACVRDAAASATADAPPTAGSPRLREALAGMLARRRGLCVEPDRIIVTHGAQQAYGLAARVLLGPGDAVAFEEPGYPAARVALAATGARVIPVPVDARGFDPAAAPIDPSVRLAFLTPSHQYPTGFTLPLDRRFALLDWAAARGAHILEDDYDSEYAHVSRALHPLAALAPDGPVLYAGTLSKLLFPGLRLGYLVAPRALTAALIAEKWRQDRSGAGFVQDAVAAFIERGGFERGLRANVAALKVRRALLEDALARRLSGRMTLVGRCDGLHALVRVPAIAARDAPAFVARAARLGVLIDDAGPCYAAPPGDARLLLSAAACPEEQIDEGAVRLAAALDDA